MNKIVRRAVFGVLSIIFAAIVLSAVYRFLNAPVAPDAGSVLFAVKKGESVQSIAQNLEKQGLIRSSNFAIAYTRLHGISLKAGMFQLSPNMKTTRIIDTLYKGKESTVRVTIPEGLSVKKTARYLEKSDLVSASEFISAASKTGFLESYGIPGKSAEGFLFPDTYYFPHGTDADSIVGVMVSTFFKKASLLAAYPDDVQNLYNKVILASIVEREYRVVDEAPLIASVFSNRLKIGMGLQSCATVEYILTEIQGKPHPEKLLLEDLEIQNDYNTYIWAGLPPGPISSPGLVALEAAFKPATTDFLYFRLTDTIKGTHSFTRSLDEHVKAGRSLELKRTVSN